MSRIIVLALVVIFSALAIGCDDQVTVNTDPGALSVESSDYPTPWIQPVIQGDQNVPVVGFDLTATGNTVTVTSLTLTLAGFGGATPQDTDLENIRVYIRTSLADILIDGPLNLSSGSVTFDLVLRPIVHPGSPVNLLVRADVSLTATLGDEFGLVLTTIEAVSANQAITPTVVDDNSSLDHRLQITQGAITMWSFVTTPQEQMLLSGSMDQVVSVFKVDASAEDLEIKSLRFYIEGDVAAVAQLRLSDVTSTTALLGLGTRTGNYVTFTGLNITIPRNGTVFLAVSADLESSQTVVNVGGMVFRVYVRNLEDNWVPGATPTATNGVINGAGETGDIEVEVVGGSTLLQNTSDPTTDQIIGHLGAGNSAYDEAGSSVTIMGDTAYFQYVANTFLNVNYGLNHPIGPYTLTGTETTIAWFGVKALANLSAANPRQALLESIRVKFVGDIELENFRWYGPADNYATPIIVDLTVISTTAPGGDPSNPPDHVPTTTYIDFAFGSGLVDSYVPYGTTTLLKLTANAYAVTGPGYEERILRVGIESGGYGSMFGDVVWRDNGDLIANPDSHQWGWLPGQSGGIMPLIPFEAGTSSSWIP